MQRLRQLTFASLQCDRKKRRTRREIFPERLEARIAPACPKGGGKGRQPHPLSVMLRVHCVQPFCNLSDPMMEDQLARRRASGALPGRCLRRFRTRRRSRLPPPAGAPRTGAPAVREIRDRLAERGVLLKKGTIVDATIISAPSSTGNESNARDPEMHQTRKGNQWHFGMKLHIGTDPRGLVHHLEGTAANVHDLTPSDRLLHGEEEQVRGDSGYRGIGKRAEHAHREVSWQIAMPPSQRRGSGGDGEGPGAGAGGASVPDHQAGVRLRHGSVSGFGEERAAACAASGLLEPDDCPAALAMTGEKCVRNLPDRPCGG